jgi:uncharacterized oligopeptide transporter (OPT) family protein
MRIASAQDHAQTGIGGTDLSSPISVKWGRVRRVAQSRLQLPRGCLAAMVIAVLPGTLIVALESRWGAFLPSPTAVGIGMLIPGAAMMPMIAGGLAQRVWKKFSARSEDVYCLPVASGFIAGEALVVLVFAIQAML